MGDDGGGGDSHAPAQERELQQAHSLLEGAVGKHQHQQHNHHHQHQQQQQQQQQQRVSSDFVDRLESLEHELNQLKRRTPTMSDSSLLATRWASYVTCRSSCVTRHASLSHVTFARHTSHVTRHTSHVTRHRRDDPLVSRGMSSNRSTISTAAAAAAAVTATAAEAAGQGQECVR